jgi:hypothetical protein
MPKLPGAGSNEKMSVEKTEFSTPSDDTENSKLRLPTSTSHRTFLGVQAAGKILQNLTDTVITRNKARFQIRLGTYASLLSNAFFPSISKARSVVASILSRGKGKDEPDEGEGKLIVKDSRSGKSYNIPIRKGSIGAMEFQQMITTSKFSAFLGRPVEGSLKVLDVGFQNTACAESSITYVYDTFLLPRDFQNLIRSSDGENGMILFRGHNIDDLYRYRCFDEVAYLLIWGELPHAWQLAQFRAEFAKLANPPQSVIDVINIFP